MAAISLVLATNQLPTNYLSTTCQLPLDYLPIVNAGRVVLLCKVPAKTGCGREEKENLVRQICERTAGLDIQRYA
ncbi:MAG: hypothetical protein ABI594_19275 [Ginsengibacter sp.]